MGTAPVSRAPDWSQAIGILARRSTEGKIGEFAVRSMPYSEGDSEEEYGYVGVTLPFVVAVFCSSFL